jgi:hypothetical protein
VSRLPPLLIPAPWRTVDRAADPVTGAPDAEHLHASEAEARAYLDALPAGRRAVSARAWPCRQRGAWLVPEEAGWTAQPVGALRAL